jgi:hypothetical protein
LQIRYSLTLHTDGAASGFGYAAFRFQGFKSNALACAVRMSAGSILTFLIRRGTSGMVNSRTLKETLQCNAPFSNPNFLKRPYRQTDGCEETIVCCTEDLNVLRPWRPQRRKQL